MSRQIAVIMLAATLTAGQGLYLKVGCWECHGFAGQGGTGTAPRLMVAPGSCEAVAAQLRHPADVMPPYTKVVLSDAQVADICVYLQSFPDYRPARDVPLLRP